MTGASGQTTEPMSRPSTTMPPAAVDCGLDDRPLEPCIRARTSGTALTAETAAFTSSSRIARATSSPSTVMDGPSGAVPDRISGSSARSATAAGSSTSTPARSIHQVMARYIAPVSR